jgi:hypothetical protein
MSQLNELAVKAAKSNEKEYLLSDGEGLFLRVRSSGKAWVYRYKQALPVNCERSAASLNRQIAKPRRISALGHSPDRRSRHRTRSDCQEK